ncbi:MAG TPA: carbamoyl phosphate synthase large subunit, partial [Demequina sp.]|nr:carbamoyl phosphate synthase large subunit [Demequina sp.]
RLYQLGFTLLATEGTRRVLLRHGIPSHVVRKNSQGKGPNGEPTIVDLINDGQVDMVVNTPSGQGARADGYEIRAAATAGDVAIITTTQQLAAAVQAIEALQRGRFEVMSLQDVARSIAMQRTPR